MVKLFSKSLQGIKGGGAPFCAALRAALCAMRSRKRPCQPKTAKRFFGGPGSHGPSGQAKERTRVLPVRRGSFCPARRAIWQAGRSCAASRCYAGFCARCPGVFSASAACARGILWHCLSCLSALCRGHRFFAAFSREAQGGIFPFSAVFRRFVPDLRAAFLPPLRRLLRLFVWPALPLPAVRFVCAVLFCFGCLFACSMLVARAFFSYLLSFAFSCLAFCLSKFFSLVAHAETGISLLVPSAALFPACVVCHLLLFRGLLRPLPVFPFCIVRARSSLIFYLLPFPVWLLPLKSLFICRSGRDGPLLSSEKKVDKDSQKGFAPLNPIPVPCGQSFSLPRCWPA